MNILYHLMILPPERPEFDAVVQEVEALRRSFGGQVVYLHPGCHPRLRLPRIVFGFHRLRQIRAWEADTQITRRSMNASWNYENCHNASSRRAGREAIEAAALLLLLLAIFFWPAVVGGRVLSPADLIFDIDSLWQPLAPEGYTHPANQILSDQVYLYFPWKIFTLRSFTQGYLPLWNPHISGGLPFVGNAQSAIFSPFNLLNYLLPLYSSYVITAILRLFVAGFFTFLFAREIGLGKPGSLLAMVVFVFSGPMVAWVGYPLSPVIAWLPAMLFTVERALTRRSGLYVIACSLTIAAQFLGGHPETSFHVMLAWGAYALYRVIVLEGWRLPRIFPQLLRITAAAVLGTLLAAVQLLPFVEALLQSATLSMKMVRAPGSLSSFVARLFFDWHTWPTAIAALLPQFFGSDLNRSYWFPYSNSVEQNMYMGVLPLALAAAVAVYSIRHRSLTHRSPVLFFVLLAVISAGIALRLPLLNAVNYLPLLNMAANGRMRLIYAFAVAVLAGLGLDEIVRGNALCRRTILRILLILALISLFLIVSTYVGFVLFRDEIIHYGRAFVEANWGTPYLPQSLEYYHALVEERYEQKLAMSRPANVVMYLPVSIALAWFALHWWRQRRCTGEKTWVYAALGLTLLDAFLVGMPFNPTIAAEHVFPTPEAIRFLQQDLDVYRINATGLALHPNSCMVFGMSDIRGYEAVVPRRYTDLIERLEGHYRHRFHSLFTQVNSPLLDLLNVKYVLTEQELGGKWELVYQGAGSVKVYRNREVLPRVFVVYRAEVVRSAAQSLERILDSTFDFRNSAVLESTPAGWAEPPESLVLENTVRIVEYVPNRVRVEVVTPADGLLVLTDTFAPGWKARLDGISTPVYIADHAFRAVVVPAGNHQIEFVYQPLSFWVGVVVSLFATAMAVGVVSVQLRSLSKHVEGSGQ